MGDYHRIRREVWECLPEGEGGGGALGRNPRSSRPHFPPFLRRPPPPPRPLCIGHVPPHSPTGTWATPPLPPPPPPPQPGRRVAGGWRGEVGVSGVRGLCAVGRTGHGGGAAAATALGAWTRGWVGGGGGGVVRDPFSRTPPPPPGGVELFCQATGADGPHGTNLGTKTLKKFFWSHRVDWGSEKWSFAPLFNENKLPRFVRTKTAQIKAPDRAPPFQPRPAPPLTPPPFGRSAWPLAFPLLLRRPWGRRP